ncbi:MAG TPA: aminoacyl-tRNA hydrolase [Chthonomonadales bacterium]|nr:aminoacyl-tRNA hydrolase [Chthonomonadales bacterium]
MMLHLPHLPFGASLSDKGRAGRDHALIVGLGNPGREYAGTRHNVGFEVIERLAERHSIPVGRRAFRSVVGSGSLAGRSVILARPMTFMNLSGEAVAAICRYYNIAPQNVIVILDDVALPLGKLRLRLKGSAGGHNGLSSVLERLDTTAVPRVRIGVGSAGSRGLVDHVLSRFRSGELEIITPIYEVAADAVEYALAHGFEAAMNRFNLSSEKMGGAPA